MFCNSDHDRTNVENTFFMHIQKMKVDENVPNYLMIDGRQVAFWRTGVDLFCLEWTDGMYYDDFNSTTFDIALTMLISWWFDGLEIDTRKNLTFNDSVFAS